MNVLLNVVLMVMQVFILYRMLVGLFWAYKYAVLYIEKDKWERPLILPELTLVAKC